MQTLLELVRNRRAADQQEHEAIRRLRFGGSGLCRDQRPGGVLVHLEQDGAGRPAGRHPTQPGAGPGSLRGPPRAAGTGKRRSAHDRGGRPRVVHRHDLRHVRRREGARSTRASRARARDLSTN